MILIGGFPISRFPTTPNADFFPDIPLYTRVDQKLFWDVLGTLDLKILETPKKDRNVGHVGFVQLGCPSGS